MTRWVVAGVAAWMAVCGAAVHARTAACADDPLRQAQLGRQHAEQLQQLQLSHGPHAPSPRLQALFARLQRVADPQGRQVWQLVGYQADTLNAHAMADGTVVVSRGLDDAALPGAWVAAALAHEMAHVMLRHGLLQTCEALQQLQAGAGGVRPLGLFGTPARPLQQLMQQHELQADAWAVRWLHQAGFPAHAMSGLLRHLGRSASADASPGSGTHPAHRLRQRRAARAEAALPKHEAAH